MSSILTQHIQIGRRGAMDCFDMKIKARRIMVIMMVSKTIDAGSIPAEPVMLRKKRTTDVDSFFIIRNSMEGN